MGGLGYSIGRNKPYAGGFITEHYGNPASGLHTVQLELNRAVYMRDVAERGRAQQAQGVRREPGGMGAPEASTGEVKALMRRVEDAEVASQADREKLMNRLERMATSIDWRLQRLEATETKE